MTKSKLMMLPDEQPNEVEFISQEAVDALNLPPGEFGDFMKAFKICVYQSEGLSLNEACKRAKLAHSSAYEEKWQILFSKARRVLLGKTMIGIAGASNLVLEKWPDLINKLIQEIQAPGISLKDRVSAMEFLFTAYMQNQEQKTDLSDQADFLSNASGFSPMRPLQIAIKAEPGSTVNVSQDNGDLGGTQIDILPDKK